MKHMEYVLNLMKFSFRMNPLLYLAIALSFFSAGVEILAMSSLLPLFTLISGRSPLTNGIITRGLHLLGIASTTDTFLWSFIVLLAIRTLTQLTGQSLSIYLAKRVMAQLCSQIFQQIMYAKSFSDINEKSIGFYISLTGDETFRASTLVISLTQFSSTALLSILYFEAIAHYSPITAIFILVFISLSLALLYQVAKISHRLGGQQIDESRKTGSLFLDALNNLKTVRALSAEKYVVGMHRSMMFKYTRTLFWVDELVLLTKLLPILLLLLIFGIWMIWNATSIKSVGLAFIGTMIVYLMRFFPVVGQVVNLLMKIASDTKSGKDVTSILRSAHINRTFFSKPLDPIKKIEFQGIYFSYDEAGEKNILNGISLKFETGKSYALIGSSGIGKSTLIDILLKFYTPTSGELFLNDESISNVADSEIRKKIILVTQDVAIFDDTVKNNICLGIQASPLQIRTACKLACIDEVIENLPEGYETRLQYQGKNLSGGQRQRIAIARALIRNPDVLILDESTNSLDKVTKKNLIDNILGEYLGKIVIFVTHDPEVMIRVDKILNLAKLNSADEM